MISGASCTPELFFSCFSFECQVVEGGMGDRAQTAWGQATSSLATGHKQLGEVAPRNPIPSAWGQIRATYKCRQNFGEPQSVTIAILAQGTHWAVAVTQALSVAGSIPTKNIFSIEFARHFDRATGHACWNTPE